MRGINRFFYRFDVIKNVYFGISIPMMLACWFGGIGFWLFLLLPISTVGLVLGLLKIPMPKHEDIVKETYSIHKEFASKIKRKYNKDIDEHYNVLGGFARYREFLCRKIGSRAIYPVCRTFIFDEQNDTLNIYIKDSPLMEEITSQEMYFSVLSPIEISVTEHKNGCVLSLSIEQQKIEILSSDKHKIKNILVKYRKYFEYDKEILASL